MGKIIFLICLLCIPNLYAQSRYFDGDDYIDGIPCNGFDWDDTSWTVEFWFKLNADQAHSLVSIYEDGPVSTTGFLVDYDNNAAGKFSCQIFSVDNPSSNAWTYDNNWHHLAFVSDGSDYYFYLDGVSIGNGGGSWAIVEPAVKNFNLGTRNYNAGHIQHMNGYLDEVRFWNYGRTREQIQSNMDKVTADKESGLLLYINLEETNGNVFDRSGNSNHSVTVVGTLASKNSPIKRIIGD